MALSAASGGLSLIEIVSRIDPNPFPLSDDVLDLRTTLPLLRHCCSSFFNAPRVCIKSVYISFRVTHAFPDYPDNSVSANRRFVPATSPDASSLR